MKKTLIFIAVFTFAFNIQATYTAKYGWFGTIGIAHGYFEKNKTNYIIKTSSKFTGFAGTISKHLQNRYISIGIVKKGILYPQKYITVRKNTKKEIKTIYIFKKNVINKIRYKNGKLDNNSTIDYFTNQDVLSLYFNLPKFIKNYNKTYFFYALGGRRKDGKIEVNFPKGRELSNIQHIFKQKGIYIKANLFNKIFAGDKGILYLVINPKNWVTLDGMVKNVLKIGDLKGSLKNFKQVP